LASDGFQAIEAFKKTKYSLILMDIHMPLCNGLEATKEIRRLEAETGEHSIIIAVTASVADEAVCAQAGMDGKRNFCIFLNFADFLPKPISKSNFLLKMNKWTHKM
jgi:CheY-like chemotaxis protein